MEATRNKISRDRGAIIVGSAWAIMILVQDTPGVTIIGRRLEFPPFGSANRCN